MNRFNYLRSTSERVLGIALPSLSVDTVPRHVWWYAAALGIVCSVWLVQETRYRRLEHDAAFLSTRLALTRAAVERVRETERDTVRLRRIAASVARARASGSVLANELATIGNTLPDDAWLTALRIGPGAISLEGRSRHVRAVAWTLAGLARVADSGTVRLLAMRADAVRSELTYSIALGRRR